MEQEITRERRRANLQRIVKERFENSITRASQGIKRDDAYVWQLLKGKQARFGERIARHIEQECALPKGWMDRENPPFPTDTPDNLLMQLIDIYGQLSDDDKHTLVIEANNLLTKESAVPSPSRPYLAPKTQSPLTVQQAAAAPHHRSPPHKK